MINYNNIESDRNNMRSRGLQLYA